MIEAARQAEAFDFISTLEDWNGRTGLDAHVGERGVKLSGGQRIAIAHRLSTIARMGRLVVMEHGRMVEQGSHAALLKAGGAYARLWARQSGEFAEAAE